LRPRTSRPQPQHKVSNDISAPQTFKHQKKNEEEKESRLTAASFCFFISIKAIPQQLFS